MTSIDHRQHQLHATQTGLQHGFALKMMELLVVPTFVLDKQGHVIIWNKACARLTGVSAREMLGTPDHWRCFYHDQRPTLADLVIRRRDEPALPPARGGEAAPSLCAENWCDMPRLGTRRYLAGDASAIYGEQGQMLAVVETLRDMTAEKQAQNLLQQLATRDGLTGLANRRCFDDTLQAEWQRALRQQQALSLLMVDVDNFKLYNDAHGHLGGDQCLQRVATALACEMRANDLVARYGGEEFAVILPNQSLKGAAIVAERIRCRVEQLRLPNPKGDSRYVTVSIGAATALPAPATEADHAQLVATADTALYRAKHMGRNRISLPGMDPA